jgi:hypothetical protein
MAESIEPGFYEGVKALNVWSLRLVFSRDAVASLTSVQVRMFQDVDVRTLQRREVDGKSL